MPALKPTPPAEAASGAPPSARPGAGTGLAPWESLACDAVGHVIEFWGFKRNQGRLWALLYLRGRPMTAAELRAALAVSKGGISMLVRDLERRNVIRRVRLPGERAWRFTAGTDLLAMIGSVLEAREARFLARVEADLREAERLARQDPEAPPGAAGRLAGMRSLAHLVSEAVRAFTRTARVDVRGVVEAIERTLRRRIPIGR